ncbi:MAG: hypothetical protein K2X82_09490 [Gemmataceae bacterium]|nr:hypothetical protein [Gemmataceae bacterium]
MSAADQPPEVQAPDPDTLRGRFHAPEVRNALFAGLAALALVFVVLFARDTDLGGLLIVILGAAGMVLRWTAAPPLVLLLLAYFLVFPEGIPDPMPRPWAVEADRFAVLDMVLAAAVLVYVGCHYRVYGLAERAFPAEYQVPPRDEGRPPRRDPATVRPEEPVRLAAFAVAAAVVGQLVWWGMTTATLDPAGDLPVRFDVPQTPPRPRAGERPAEPPLFPAPVTRLLLLVGLVLFAGLAGRVVFGYWRLRRLSPAEAGLVLQEAAWDGVRRERVRIERWRVWGRGRRAKRAAKANRDGGGR